MLDAFAEPGVTCGARVLTFCVNQLSAVGRREETKRVFFSFSQQKMSEFMLYGNKIWLSLPFLPPDGPCGERVIIWPI